VILPLSTGLLVLCFSLWTWGTLTGRIGYAGPLLDPVAWDGRPVVLSLFEVTEVRPDGFVAGKGALRLVVLGPSDGLTVGAEVDVGGTWSADAGAVVLEWHELAEGRAGKRRLGVLGVLIVCLILPLGIGRGRGGLVIRG
jgi:hypothetical protein